MKLTREELEAEIERLKEENETLQRKIEKFAEKKAGTRVAKGIYRAKNGTLYMRPEGVD
jgi:cell division protein FtsB